MVSLEDMSDMLNKMMAQQRELQNNINEQIMGKIVKAIQEADKEASNTAATAAATATATASAAKGNPEKKYPSKQFENRTDPKSFHGTKKLAGGESGYKEWKLDVEVTVESICAGLRAMLTNYMVDPKEEEPDYEFMAIQPSGDKLEHAQLRSK